MPNDKQDDLIAVQISPRRWVVAKRRFNDSGSPDLMDARTPIYEAVGGPTDYVTALVKARDLRGGCEVIRHDER